MSSSKLMDEQISKHMLDSRKRADTPPTHIDLQLTVPQAEVLAEYLRRSSDLFEVTSKSLFDQGSKESAFIHHKESEIGRSFMNAVLAHLDFGPVSNNHRN